MGNEAILQQVVTALASAGAQVYDGFVPGSLPMDGKYIRPYFVVWAGEPDNPAEDTSDGMHSLDTRIFRFQVTAVAPTPAATRQLTAAGVTALNNLRVGTGRVKPDPEGFRTEVPQLDPSESPARFLLPTPWRLISN